MGFRRDTQRHLDTKATVTINTAAGILTLLPVVKDLHSSKWPNWTGLGCLLVSLRNARRTGQSKAIRKRVILEHVTQLQ